MITRCALRFTYLSLVHVLTGWRCTTPPCRLLPTQLRRMRPVSPHNPAWLAGLLVTHHLPYLRRQRGRPEQQVHDVVQDRHLEDAEQEGAGLVPGELQLVVVTRDPRDEPGDADEQEHHPLSPASRWRAPRPGRATT